MGELSKQINLYSVDTKAFYTSKERNYSLVKTWASIRINNIKSNLQAKSQEFVDNDKEEYIKMCKYDMITELIQEGYDDEECDLIIEQEFDENIVIENIKKQIYDILISVHKHYNKYANIQNESKSLFNKAIKENKEVRVLNKYYLNDRNKISLFASNLTRTMGFEVGEITNDMLVIRPYHYIILEQLINNGYNYNNNHYIMMTASAGQIRTKKCVFINEELWNKYEKTLLCGLTKDSINENKGMNLTKYMAYVALNSSATEPWEEFDIDKSIVIKDFETNVNSWVDYIDVPKFKDANSIEECIDRRRMDVPIPHSDGAGWILPSVSKKNFMVRLPWIKGLLTPCDYLLFCKTERNIEDETKRYKIVDYWGKEYDLIKDDIQVVFTESQFKAIKYYKDWDEYKDAFKEFNCKANTCNIEPDTKHFRQASLNYQMLQTITDITDEEIKHFTDPVDEYITNGYTELETQLDILGVNKYYKTNLQKALEIYPEMVQESYVRTMLSECLNKKKKQAKYAKFKVDAKYTFAIPDIYAWMEFVFNGDKNPKGILKHGGTVSCRLYKDIPHLTVNRSPHLYRELGTRINVCNKLTRKWFITDGCYTSSHDLLTKLLQNDNDGDKYLVIADEVYYKIARRNMKDIVPLYYEMGKAKAQMINSQNLYKALTDGYKYGNVGQYSNKITVMFNEPKIDLNAIKILACLNNFYIDGAKTGYMPEMSDAIKDRIKKSNGKLPYFFRFAKDKESKQVKGRNSSTVNRICKNIENIKQSKFKFDHHGVFRKEVLFNNKDIMINEDLISHYLKLDREKNLKYKNSDLDRSEILNSINNDIRNGMIQKSIDISVDYIDMVDMITKYIYTKHKNLKKTTLWDVFGEDIINNINKNLRLSLNDKRVVMCEECGKRIIQKTNNQKYCKKCAVKINIIKTNFRKY